MGKTGIVPFISKSLLPFFRMSLALETIYRQSETLKALEMRTALVDIMLILESLYLGIIQ
jgi:hypothetical protein